MLNSIIHLRHKQGLATLLCRNSIREGTKQSRRRKGKLKVGLSWDSPHFVEWFGLNAIFSSFVSLLALNNISFHSISMPISHILT